MYRTLYWVVTTAMLVTAAEIVIGGDEVDPTEEAGAQPAIQHELVTELIVEPANYRASVKAAMQAHLRSIGLIVTLRTPLKEHLPLHANAMLTLSKAHGQLYAIGSESPGTSAAIWSNGSLSSLKARVVPRRSRANTSISAIGVATSTN